MCSTWEKNRFSGLFSVPIRMLLQWREFTTCASPARVWHRRTDAVDAIITRSLKFIDPEWDLAKKSHPRRGWFQASSWNAWNACCFDTCRIGRTMVQKKWNNYWRILCCVGPPLCPKPRNFELIIHWSMVRSSVSIGKVRNILAASIYSRNLPIWPPPCCLLILCFSPDSTPGVSIRVNLRHDTEAKVFERIWDWIRKCTQSARKRDGEQTTCSLSNRWALWALPRKCPSN